MDGSPAGLTCEPCEPLRRPPAARLFPGGCTIACRGHTTSGYDCGHGHLDASAPGLLRGLVLPCARKLLLLSLVAVAAARAVKPPAEGADDPIRAHWRAVIPTACATAGAALVAVLVGRALLVVGSAYRDPAVPDDAAQVSDDAAAIRRCLDRKHLYAQRLGAAIRCKTVSHDPDELRSQGPAAAVAAVASLDAELRKLHELIRRSFPRVHASLDRLVVNDWSLIYIWRANQHNERQGGGGGGGGSLPYMVYAHLDVVPAPDPEEWLVDPWSGEVKDGFIWGRGAIDDKHAVMGHLEAVEDLLEGGHTPGRDVYLCFGHDEEVGGGEGAARVAAELAARGMAFEFMLDEGLMIVDGIVPCHSRPVAMVCVGEKGYVTTRLTVASEPGHASLPPSKTAIGTLACAVSRLEQSPFPSHSGIAHDMFGALAGGYDWPMALLMANLWLFAPLLARFLAAKPKTAAVVRTTTALTIFRSGAKENVLPASATAVVNHRIHPADSVASVLRRDRHVINDPAVHMEERTKPS